MAIRSFKNAVLLFKQETTSGTDAAPTNTANAILVQSDATVEITPQMADRSILYGYLGAPDSIYYSRTGVIKFSVEMAGSGAAGTAPAFGPILKACGFSETVTASSRVDYTLVSTSIPTSTIWVYVDGILMKFTYCVGTVDVSGNMGELGKINFSFTGLVTDPTATAVPVPTLTAFTRPVACAPGITSLQSGVSYSAGAFTGGTAINYKSFTLDLANDVQKRVLSATEDVGIYDRAPKMSVTYDGTAAAEVAAHAAMKAGTIGSYGWQLGTTAGNIAMVHAAFAVPTGVSQEKDGSTIYVKQDFTLKPSVGNDELRIVFK